MDIYNLEELENLRGELWIALKKVPDGDFTELNRLNSLIQNVEKLKETLKTCENQYNEIKDNLYQTNHSAHIVVTNGAIKQNYLTITEPLRLGICPNYECEITIQTPIGDFTTLVLPNLNRLQERSFIGRLYKELNITSGKKLLWSEIEKNKIYKLECKSLSC